MFRAIENLLTKLKAVRINAGATPTSSEQTEISSNRSVKNNPWKSVHWRVRNRKSHHRVATNGKQSAEPEVHWRAFIQSNRRYQQPIGSGKSDGVATLTDLPLDCSRSVKPLYNDSREKSSTAFISRLSDTIVEKALRQVEPSQSTDCSHKACDDICLETLLQVKEDRLQRLVASPKTTRALLKKLSHAADADIRAAVAFAPTADEEIHLTLAQDESIKVRCMLAQSAYISMQLLKKLIRDESPYVAFTAKKNIERRQKSETVAAQQTFCCEPVFEKQGSIIFEPAR